MKMTTDPLEGATGAGGTFEGIRRHLDYFMVQGPLRGYFLEQTKSVLVVSPRNVPGAEAFFRGYGLKIVTGSQHLGICGVKGGKSLVD